MRKTPQEVVILKDRTSTHTFPAYLALGVRHLEKALPSGTQLPGREIAFNIPVDLLSLTIKDDSEALSEVEEVSLVFEGK